MALRADGSLVGWGRDDYGQATAPAGNDFVAIAAGLYHSIALRADGSLIGWGQNDLGQTNVPAGSFIAMDSAGWHGVALTPEPGALGLLAIGGLALLRRRR